MQDAVELRHQKFFVVVLLNQLTYDGHIHNQVHEGNIFDFDDASRDHDRERIGFIYHYLGYMKEGRFKRSGTACYNSRLGAAKQIVRGVENDPYYRCWKRLLIEVGRETGRTSNDKFVVGEVSREAGHQGHELFNFHLTAAGKQSYHLFTDELILFRKGRISFKATDGIEPRITHLVDFHPPALIEVDFKRQNTEHVVDYPFNLKYTLLIPGPYLR